jgi:hypothetical protein
MKNLFKVALVAAGIFSFTQGHAQDQDQDHKDKNVGHQIGKTATTVGHATAHTAVIGDAAITDKRYRGKMGPGGQTIYINKNSHYFYVDHKGKRVYLKKSELRDKPMK